MKNALTLLQLATDKFPPTNNCNHGLILSSLGGLQFSLMIDNQWKIFYLDGPDDLEKDPKIILDEIEQLLLSQKEQ